VTRRPIERAFAALPTGAVNFCISSWYAEPTSRDPRTRDLDRRLAAAGFGQRDPHPPRDILDSWFGPRE
jgi:hypothetical protein